MLGAQSFINGLGISIFTSLCIIGNGLGSDIPTTDSTAAVYDEFHDSFEESLKVKVLSTGNIYAYFEFLINDIQLSNHTRFFPRPLSDLLIHHSVQELHYSLTQGYWRTESWGDPVLSAPGGAQVIAWFNAKDEKQAQQNWKGLTSRLSGLTCASLNFLEDRNSISPRFGYRPIGLTKSDPRQLFGRVGSLPKENVCMENLTPWTKLLPCGLSRGLASLLRSKQVFNTHYHSAGISFVQTETGVQLKLTLSLVFDAVVKGIYDPPPSPNDNFVRKVFGSAATFPCFFSQNTSVHLWANNTWMHATPQLINTWKTTSLPKKDESKLDLIFTPVKYLGGYGQADGEIIIEMTNHLTVVLPVLFVEVLPWYVRPYLHTMKTQVTPAGGSSPELGSLFHYTPGRDREGLHKLEMGFQLPPKSTVRLSFVVEKRHLRWDEYPPDANHGFYLEPTHFEVNGTDSGTRYYSSRKLLVNLSTPDFSMPYNVICLTCTVVALAFGPLHNITTKSLKLTPKDDKSRLSSKIKSGLRRLWRKLRGIENEKKETVPVQGQGQGAGEDELEPMDIDMPEAEIVLDSKPVNQTVEVSSEKKKVNTSSKGDKGSPRKRK